MLQSFNRTTVKTYAVGEPTTRLSASRKLTAFLHMLHTIEEKRAWMASKFNTSLFQMVAQRNSRFLLGRCPWHQLQTPTLAFPVPSLPHLLLPPGSHSLLSTQMLLGHYSEGEHSYPSWGRSEEKTRSPKTGAILFSWRTSMKQDSGFFKKTLLITQIHGLSQIIPASVSVFIGFPTWHCFHSQEKKIKLLVHVFQWSLSLPPEIKSES